MTRYILYLYKQYCDSLGKECINLNLFNDNDFIEWIVQLNKNTGIYRDFIDSLGVSIGKNLSIELGKGEYDSIGKDFTTVVSPFAETMGIANTRLIVGDDTPIIIYDSRIYGIGECNSIITHNPFIEKDVRNLIMMHNMGINICLGIYGDTSDKDSKNKLEILRKSSELMTDDLEFYYDTCNSNYFACVKSERKVKKKILTR